jgi:hypothetical protein
MNWNILFIFQFLGIGPSYSSLQPSLENCTENQNMKSVLGLAITFPKALSPSTKMKAWSDALENEQTKLCNLAKATLGRYTTSNGSVAVK